MANFEKYKWACFFFSKVGNFMLKFYLISFFELIDV